MKSHIFVQHPNSWTFELKNTEKIQLCFHVARKLMFLAFLFSAATSLLSYQLHPSILDMVQSFLLCAHLISVYKRHSNLSVSGCVIILQLLCRQLNAVSFRVEALFGGVNLQAELLRQLRWVGRSLPWSCSSGQRKTCLDTWPSLFVTRDSVSLRLSADASSRLHH